MKHTADFDVFKASLRDRDIMIDSYIVKIPHLIQLNLIEFNSLFLV